MRTIFVLIVSFLVQNTIAQEKKLLIIGTMHEVPSIVSHSYRPLLKYAKKYKPEAIFVEDIRPDDTLSLKNFTPRFLKVADSISHVNTLDEQKFNDLRSKNLADMDAADFEFLSEAYLQMRDRANYTYYDYLKTYGIAGAKKPLRKENGDLIFPLAISMGITELLPVDDHQTEPEYQRAWRGAMKASSGADDGKILAKMIKKDSRSRVWPALWGRLGKHTNKPATLQRFYQMNSCRYVTKPNEYSQAVQQLWDARNHRIAENIAEQMKAHPYHKGILIIGAGHVISVKEMLRQVYPELQVRLMYEE
jgi:hypothetical protein